MVDQSKIKGMVQQLEESTKTILLQNLEKRTLQQKYEMVQAETMQLLPRQMGQG